MISEIQIANTATYTGHPTTVGPLKELNFLFGGNGTGKTTISRLLDAPREHPSCQVTWQLQRPLRTLVYNVDFIRKNFVEDGTLPGVFTLGEENVALQEQIASVKSNIESLDEKLKARLATLNGPDDHGGKTKEADDEFDRFKKQCWSWKSRYDDDFREAFSGYRGNKKNFAERVIKEHEKATSSSGPLPDVDQLRELAEELFGERPEKEPILALVEGAGLARLGENEVLNTPVIGKEGVDIAALISKLGSSDWVRQGTGYLAGADGRCPFCQQAVPESLEQDLSEFFDDAYDRQMSRLKALALDYSSAVNAVRMTATALKSSDQKFLDGVRLGEALAELERVLENNERRLEQKVDEPSSVIQLEPTNGIVASVNEIVEEANTKARQQHQRVDNFQEEKKQLVARVWRYIAMANESDIAIHLTTDKKIRKAIEGLQGGISQLRNDRAEKEHELAELERRITSTKPTVKQINGLLRSYGFESFYLETSENDKGYRLVRPDGHSDATQSLSEGERTFVAFLYFFHLVDGGHHSSSMVTDPRCVVVDDPVSSLDSDVLFVVSALIRQLARRILDGDGMLKQLLVLTHNVYFHREVTFGYDSPSMVTYWTVRKEQNQTRVEPHQKNPVTTTYELLWDELKRAGNASIPSPTVRNVMRRILEYYFKLLGKTKLEDLASKFDGKDQMVCAAMISWIHAGSHASFDDPSHSMSCEDFARQMEVFRLIFEKTGQIAHYDMMMGT